MKGRLVSVAILAAFASVSTVAGPVIKGKLISHKEWTTGGAKWTFKEVLPSFHVKKKVFGLRDNNLSKQFIDASSRITTATIKHVQIPDGSSADYIDVEGKSHVFIMNMTSAPVSYIVMRYVCVSNIPDNAEDDQDDDQVTSLPAAACGFSTDEMSLDPQGYFSSDTLPGFVWVSAAPGMYSVEIKTRISTDQEAMNFYSSDSAEVVVPDEAVKKMRR